MSDRSFASFATGVYSFQSAVPDELNLNSDDSTREWESMPSRMFVTRSGMSPQAIQQTDHVHVVDATSNAGATIPDAAGNVGAPITDAAGHVGTPVCGVGTYVPANAADPWLTAASDAAAGGAFMQHDPANLLQHGDSGMRPHIEDAIFLSPGATYQGPLGSLSFEFRWGATPNGVSAFANSDEGYSITGGLGSDFLSASRGPNILDGGLAGNDILRGGIGSDTLIASRHGNNEMTGGQGADTFILSAEGGATITDFQPGVDKLVLDTNLPVGLAATTAVQQHWDIPTLSFKDVSVPATVLTVNGHDSLIIGAGVADVAASLNTTSVSMFGHSMSFESVALSTTLAFDAH